MKKFQVNLEDILADAAEDSLEVPVSDGIFAGFKVFVALIMMAVLAQVFYIAVLNKGQYMERATANASNFRIIGAERGVITDRFSKPLTNNEKSFFAFLVVKELPKNDADLREESISKISQLLNINKEWLNAEILKRSSYFDDEILLKDNLSYDELVQLSGIDFPGLRVEEGFSRTHQVPLAFSHVIGYTSLATPEEIEKNGLSSDEETGKMGLEKYYDKYLRGVNGRQVYFRDSLGKIQEKKVVSLPVQGGQVQTFIDRDFQEYFYNRLQEELHRLGRKIGVGLAINPKNGEVLALFGVPGFDENQVASYLGDSDRVLFTRAVSGVYNPGSTIKPLVALAALTEGVITPEKKIYSKGYLEVPNPFLPANPSIFKDWKPHGWVDARSAIARSSNVYFYEVGGGFQDQKGLGITLLNKWWKKFLLDKKTNIDLPGEESGFLPDPNWKKDRTGAPWLLGDTYNVSIGQGDLMMTPIELLTYIGAIANGGIFYEPRIMKKVVSGDGRAILDKGPVVLSDISKEVAPYIEEVRLGMWDGVHEPYGTSYLLHDIPIPLYAKTGSAQVENNTKVNAFSVGFTNDLAILVLVENAREGSVNTIPVARDVFMWYYENRIKTVNSSPVQ